MTREVGTTFQYYGVRLRVERAELPYCGRCFFQKSCQYRDKAITGTCTKTPNSDDYLTFVKVEEGGEE